MSRYSYHRARAKNITKNFEIRNWSIISREWKFNDVWKVTLAASLFRRSLPYSDSHPYKFGITFWIGSVGRMNGMIALVRFESFACQFSDGWKMWAPIFPFRPLLLFRFIRMNGSQTIFCEWVCSMLVHGYDHWAVSRCEVSIWCWHDFSIIANDWTFARRKKEAPHHTGRCHRTIASELREEDVKGEESI